MQFDIHPYTGALPITFGMPRKQVHRLLGPPESSFPIWDGSGLSDHFAGGRYNVGYDNAGAVKHLGFSPGGAGLSFQGGVIWTLETQPDPNPILLALDPSPFELVGFWFFVRIGVTSTGYHDNHLSQRAITVFPKGSNAELLAKAKPADTSKYQAG